MDIWGRGLLLSLYLFLESRWRGLLPNVMIPWISVNINVMFLIAINCFELVRVFTFGHLLSLPLTYSLNWHRRLKLEWWLRLFLDNAIFTAVNIILHWLVLLSLPQKHLHRTHLLREVATDLWSEDSLLLRPVNRVDLSDSSRLINVLFPQHINIVGHFSGVFSCNLGRVHQRDWPHVTSGIRVTGTVVGLQPFLIVVFEIQLASEIKHALHWELSPQRSEVFILLFPVSRIRVEHFKKLN